MVLLNRAAAAATLVFSCASFASVAATGAAQAPVAFGDLGTAVPAAAPLGVLAGAPVAQDDDAAFSETRIEVLKRGVLVAMRDLTGNGALELIQIDGARLSVRTLGTGGQYSATPTYFQWPSKTVGWDFADLDGDGRTELVVVADGKTVTRSMFSAETGWSKPETLFESETYLPSGVARVPFARDIDADGKLDLVMPGPGRFQLRLNRGPGEASDGSATDPAVPTTLAWSEEVRVTYEPEIDYELGNPNRLSSTFGQSVRVPLFSMFDADGDGRQDLVSEMDERVAFHLAQPEISASPTWELDLSALKTDFSASDIDLQDLLGAVSGRAQWRIADLDGTAPNDLIIGSEGTFKVYLGGAKAGPLADPDQVLKASGNVLYFFVRNVIGDDKPDLQIVRGERISLARLLKYLIVPGQLDFDVFTYQCEAGGTFARRPTKRTTLALRVPRLLGLIDDFEEVSDSIEANWDIPAQRVDWDEDGQTNDIVDETNGMLSVYLNCAPGEQQFENLTLARGIDGIVERLVLDDLDRLSDGGEFVIDLGELDSVFKAPGKALRDAARNREAAVTHPLWKDKDDDDRSIRPIDLDGDGRTDFISTIEAKKGTFRIQFLVRK